MSTNGTKLERAVADALTALGEPFVAQHRISRWVVDFLLPGRLLVLEADGAYWHQRPEAQERDRRKDTDLTARGVRVVRLSEQAIKSDVMLAVTAALVEAAELEPD